MDYFQGHISHQHLPSPTKEIETILLSGGGAKLKGLPEYLTDQLNVKTKIANPWVNILSSEDLPQEKSLIRKEEQSLSYTTALGLALRGIKWQ